ncbi:MAG: Holliday junction resolvase RuvX [Proteobacteria bacterium]|nr:Holliday junction resolvase RuvX [Pseudomonadota bacterium]
MTVLSIEGFKNEFLLKIPKGRRLLGIDVGQKRIGLALSDPSFMIATPFKILERKTFGEVSQKILKIIEMEEVAALVVGIPLEMNGEEGRASQSVRHFVYNFLKLKDLPVVFWDERFSTIAVTRTLLDADLSREKRSFVVDKMAASFILQGFLDFLRNQ